MKKILTAFVFCFLSSYLLVNGQNYFDKIFNFNASYFSVVGKHCLNSNKEEFIITTYGYPSIMKIDSLGNIMWSYYYTSMGYPEYVKPTSDGGCTVMGSKFTLPYGIYIFHVNDVGNVQWSKFYNINGGYRSFITSNDGGYMYLGNLHRPFIVKFDSIGNIEWSKRLNISYSQQLITEVVQSAGGDYYAVGSYNDTSSVYSNPMIWRIGMNGHSKTLTILKGFSIDASRINTTPDNGFIISGRERTTNGAFDHTVVIKLNHKLKVQWAERINDSYGFNDDWDSLDDVAVDSGNGNMLLISGDRLVTMMDSSGNFLWNKALYYSNVFLGYSSSCFLNNNTISLGIEADANGYLLFSADATYPPECFFLNYSGSVTTFSLSDSVIPASQLAKSYQDSVISFNQNSLNATDLVICNPLNTTDITFSSSIYLLPNPVSSLLTISFSSSEKQTIELRIYNTLGKQIYVEKEEITKGKFEKEINMEKWSDGIYFLQVKTKEGNLNRKIVIQH